METMSLNLRSDGKIAVVTGASRGIGRGIARALAEAGATVICAARDLVRLEAVVAEITAAGGTAHAHVVDVASRDSIETLISATVAAHGRLDILVNNAGTVNRKSVMDLELAAWEHVMSTNLTGPFLCTKHAARLMKAGGAGKIINIASLYGLVAPSKGLQVPYAVSKSGLIALTRVNAVELAEHGIQVNAIAPGYYFTEMTAELSGAPLEQSLKRRTPSGRLGETDDLVGTCLYLASRASDHVTGVCIPVDGGYLASDGLDRG